MSASQLDLSKVLLHKDTNQSVSKRMIRSHNSAQTRTKLLEAARDVIRAKGYSATSVDDICAVAGVTKGGFFHHFESKERLGVAAVEQFEAMASTLFGSAPYSADPDPRARVLGYVDFRASMLQGEIAQYTCLMGTTVQEVYATHPDLRAACDRGMSEHVAELTRDIEAAKQVYAPDAPWSAQSVGYFMQAVLQGAFIFAKAKQNPQVALDDLAHLRRYLEMLLGNADNDNAKEPVP
jgi:TetR/AcrR family transcriptional regulator, transcriptional repressor for nem operon